MTAPLNLIGQKILGYNVEERIGSGGYGTVYKVSKSNESGKYVSALKHIVLPTETQYYDVLNSMGGDHDMAEDHFKSVLQNIIDEINLLQSLSEKNNNHIVTYYDNEVEKSEDPLRYDIFIRMEYMMPFTKYIIENQLTVEGVIDLGTDILSALDLCHSNGVIHRDIKDDNIFVNKEGNFKIGDFGVAKALKDKSRATSMKGTPAYIAPEILALEEYDHTVDFYSLGILLYKLLNYARIPFLPPYPEKYTMDDIEYSVERRQKGEVPCRPLNAPEIFGDVVIKACSLREKRFNTAAEFKSALQQVKQSLSRAELEKVVMQATKKLSQPESTQPTLGGETNNAILNPRGFEETLGAVRPHITLDNSKQQQTLGSSRDIFETGGAYSSEPKNNRHENQPSKNSNTGIFNLVGNGGLVGDNLNARSMEQSRQSEKVYPHPDVVAKTILSRSNTNYSSQVRKNDFSFVIYLSPFLVLIVAIIYYANTFSFLSNVPYVSVIFSKLIFSLLISISFITSLFLASKQLQERRKQTSDKALLTGREPHHIMLGITSLFKETMEQQEDPTAFSSVWRKIKMLEDHLKIEKAFGNEKGYVIEVENEIASMLSEMNSQVVSLQKRNYGQLQHIEQLISKINDRLRKRKEIMKR